MNQHYIHYTRRNGWERYGCCVLYEIEGVVQYALYLDDHSCNVYELRPVKISKGRGEKCYSTLLRQGLYILYNSKWHLYYNHDNGCLLDAVELEKEGEV